jgi:antitoxin PrlF
LGKEDPGNRAEFLRVRNIREGKGASLPGRIFLDVGKIRQCGRKKQGGRGKNLLLLKRGAPEPSRNREGRMITSKLTAKAQTTIPQAVRLHLGLKEGDLLGFAIEGERVVLCKPLIRNAKLAQPVLAEWESEADQRSYYGL